MIVVTDAPQVIAHIERVLKIRIARPCNAFGYMTGDGEPIAGVVVNDYTGSNCELTVVAEKGRITRSVLRHLASHVFHKLGCRRATIRTRKSNKALLRMIPRFGFSFECVAKHFYPDDDAVVFRMLKRNCQWIER